MYIFHPENSRSKKQMQFENGMQLTEDKSWQFVIDILSEKKSSTNSGIPVWTIYGSFRIFENSICPERRACETITREISGVRINHGVASLWLISAIVEKGESRAITSSK